MPIRKKLLNRTTKPCYYSLEKLFKLQVAISNEPFIAGVSQPQLLAAFERMVSITNEQGLSNDIKVEQVIQMTEAS